MDILNATDVFESMLVLSNFCEEQLKLAFKTGIGIINSGHSGPQYHEFANANGFNPYFTALKYVIPNPVFCSIPSSFNSIELVEKTIEFINGNISTSDKYFSTIRKN